MSESSKNIADGEWVRQNNGKWSKDLADTAAKDNIELVSAEQVSPSKCNSDIANVNLSISPYEKAESSINSVHHVNVMGAVRTSDIMKRLSSLETQNIEMKKELKKLRSRLRDAENDIDDQYENLTFLEKQLSKLDQYGRRENIEIVGIPANISDQELESVTLEILREIGLYHLNHFHIVGCHRIGKADKFGRKNTIVRFLNRKDAILCLKLKRNLYRCKSIGYENLSIVENLCPAYKSIFEEVSQLKNDGKIKKMWTFNGVINYKITDDHSEKPVKVFHNTDLENLYNVQKLE